MTSLDTLLGIMTKGFFNVTRLKARGDLLKDPSDIMPYNWMTGDYSYIQYFWSLLQNKKGQFYLIRCPRLKPRAIKMGLYGSIE